MGLDQLVFRDRSSHHVLTPSEIDVTIKKERQQALTAGVSTVEIDRAIKNLMGQIIQNDGLLHVQEPLFVKVCAIIGRMVASKKEADQYGSDYANLMRLKRVANIVVPAFYAIEGSIILNHLKSNLNGELGKHELHDFAMAFANFEHAAFDQCIKRGASLAVSCADKLGKNYLQINVESKKKALRDALAAAAFTHYSKSEAGILDPLPVLIQEMPSMEKCSIEGLLQTSWSDKEPNVSQISTFAKSQVSDTHYIHFSKETFVHSTTKGHSLSDQQVVSLANIGRSIEAEFGCGMCVRWILDQKRGSTIILQAHAADANAVSFPDAESAPPVPKEGELTGIFKDFMSELNVESLKRKPVLKSKENGLEALLKALETASSNAERVHYLARILNISKSVLIKSGSQKVAVRVLFKICLNAKHVWKVVSNPRSSSALRDFAVRWLRISLFSREEDGYSDSETLYSLLIKRKI